MRPILIRLLPLVAMLLALPLIASCSSSGDNGPTPTTRPITIQSLAPLQPQPEPVQALDATATQPTDGVVDVAAQNVAFSPNLVAVTTGSTVTIRLTNKDGQSHSLRIAGPDGQYQTDDDAVTEPSTVAPGGTGELTFAPLVAGSYTFRCDFHPGSMGGQIQVTAATPWALGGSVDSQMAVALYLRAYRRTAVQIKWREWGEVANQVGKRYQCTKCGTEMIVTKGGEGSLACCGQPMQQKQ